MKIVVLATTARNLSDYIIETDGTILKTLDYNDEDNEITIAYIGGKSYSGKSHGDSRTPNQKKSLKVLIDKLKNQYPTAILERSEKFDPYFDPSLI